MLRTLLLVAFVASVSGCALFTHPVEKPTAQVRGVAVTGVSFSGLDGEIALDIQNPNAFGVPLSEIEWQLSVGSAQAVTGRIELSETIPARGTAPVRAILHVDAMNAIDVGREISRGVRTYQLAARLTFTTRLGSVDVAVQSTGELGS
jgi:LEA14-like dessication related protein